MVVVVAAVVVDDDDIGVGGAKVMGTSTGDARTETGENSFGVPTAFEKRVPDISSGAGGHNMTNKSSRSRTMAGSEKIKSCQRSCKPRVSILVLSAR